MLAIGVATLKNIHAQRAFIEEKLFKIDVLRS